MNTKMHDTASLTASAKPKLIYRKASPTELIYVATGMVVVSRSTISGKIGKPEFHAAVAQLEERFPILRAVISDQHFMARDDTRSTIETWVPDHECSAEEMYARLLNAELNPAEALCRMHVIARADGLEVFMLTSHAVTDATSLIELHSCLAHLCDSVVMGWRRDPGVQHFPEPVDQAVEACLNALGHSDPRPSYTGAFAEIPMRAAYDGGAVTHRLQRVLIGARDVERLHETAHAAGSSVHALLLAAFALAVRRVSKVRSPKILMRSSVDMRRRLEPHVATDLVFTAITGHITQIPDLDQPLADIARFIFDDIHEGAVNGSILRDYVDYPRVFGSPDQAPVAMNLSDIQSVRFRWPTEQLRVTGFEYALGWLKKFPNVSISIFDGTLVANIVYVEEFVDPGIMQVLAEDAASRLVSPAGTHTGSGDP